MAAFSQAGTFTAQVLSCVELARWGRAPDDARASVIKDTSYGKPVILGKRRQLMEGWVPRGWSSPP